ncbi:unnamed protein product [Penicillium glandicola]
MNDDECLEILYRAEDEIWRRKVDRARIDGTLSAWVTTLLPGQPSCHFDSWSTRGFFNLSKKLFSEDGTPYLLRFPRGSSVSSDFADEKVAMEVEAIDLIRKNTTIPVPTVHAWGLAEANPLGLGPFILMEFIEGVTIQDVFGGGEGGLLKTDIPNTDLETIYRQMANFTVQLFKIDLPRIGTLPTPVTGFAAPIRPLTMKAHDILREAGVNTFGDRTQGFSTTSEYLHYVIRQDEQRLRDQPNSFMRPEKREASFISMKAVQALIHTMINKDYDQGPFKLIYDDLDPSNLIFKSEDDLTIVGMVDFEFVYAGPAQLLASAPRWLLSQRPISENLDSVNEDQEPYDLSELYNKHLEIFQRVLYEEEEKLSGSDEKEVSKLVAWCKKSGAMLLHVLAATTTYDWSRFPPVELLEEVGAEKWKELTDELVDQEDLRAFLAKKPDELKRYNEKLAKVKKYRGWLRRGSITKEDFIAKVRGLLMKGATSDQIEERSFLDRWMLPWL